MSDGASEHGQGRDGRDRWADSSATLASQNGICVGRRFRTFKVIGHPAVDDGRSQSNRHKGHETNANFDESRALLADLDRLPGESICEHLPKQAAMLDKFTLLRSVDCRKSNHEPNKVVQTGHREVAPRANPNGERYPAI